MPGRRFLVSTSAAMSMIQGPARNRGPPPPLATHAHQPAERLHERIVAGPARQRAGTAEGTDAAVDQTFVARAQGRGVEPQFLDHAGPQILDQHIGALLDQPHEARALVGVTQIDGDGEFVAVEALEDLRGAAPIGRRPVARVVTAIALLDLDHRRAQVGKDFARVGRGDAVAELDHGDVGERRRAGHGFPGLLTPERYTPRGRWASRLAAFARGDYALANSPAEDTHMPAPLTRSLGSFAASLKYEMLPAQAIEAVRLGFPDCVAVMMAGVREPVLRIVSSTMVRTDPKGEARICLGRERASAIDAALCNGVAGHALDYDDVALAGHPSTVLVPAILAEAEATGADGRAAITAYVAGYETWARLVERDPDPYHRKGWHPTAVAGPVAAAAAIANLRRLDADKATMAIAVGASLSAGLVANFGTMTKPFHAGRAAASGVTAARLAQNGMTGSPDAIEHPLGLLAALSQIGRASDREREEISG